MWLPTLNKLMIVCAFVEIVMIKLEGSTIISVVSLFLSLFVAKIILIICLIMAVLIVSLLGK